MIADKLSVLLQPAVPPWTRFHIRPSPPGGEREAGDVQAIVALLTDDAWLRMPPLPPEYQGRAAVADFLETIAFRGTGQYRLIPTRANGQPAYGCYLHDAYTPIARAHGLLVITLAGERIWALTGFSDNSVLGHFGLPRTLRD